MSNLILIIASLFSLFGFPKSDMDEMSKREKIADKVSYCTACKLKKRHGLKFIGFGLGREGHPLLAYMSIDFNLYRSLEMDEARRMIVDCVEEYLSDINASEELKPYILNSHFTFQNAEVGIFPNDPDSPDPKKLYVRIVSLRNGKINYYLWENSDINEREIIREPYEEAFARVKAE